MVLVLKLLSVFEPLLSVCKMLLPVWQLLLLVWGLWSTSLFVVLYLVIVRKIDRQPDTQIDR